MRALGRRTFLVLGTTLLVLAGGCAITRLFGTDEQAEAADLTSVLQVSPGSSVADVGAGQGAFSIAVARHVGPDGRVFATEIDEERLSDIRDAAAEAGLKNVTVVEASESHTGLPDACCDAAFLRGVYHHITQPDATNASLFRALRPGARLAIIDFRPRWWLSLFVPVRGVPANRGGHGVPPEVVVEELEAAGFALEQRIDDWSGGHYCLVFRRGSTPADTR